MVVGEWRTARKLASMADYLVVRVADGGVRLRGFILEVGPLGTVHEIASHSCRGILAKRGLHDEADALLLTESYGFRYVALPWMWGRRGQERAS